MNINLSNPTTNQVKQTKLGLSWTVFFFSWIPMLFRGDWSGAIITFFINVLLEFIFFPLVIIFRIVLLFIYNKMYVKKIIKQGFIPADKASQDIILSKGISLPQQVMVEG